MIDTGLSRFAFVCCTQSCASKCLYCFLTTGQAVPLARCFLGWQHSLLTMYVSILCLPLDPSLSSRGPAARTRSTNQEVPPLLGSFGWKRLRQLEPSPSLLRAAWGATQVGRTQVGRPQVGRTQVGRPQVGRPGVGRTQVGRPQVRKTQAGGSQAGGT